MDGSSWNRERETERAGGRGSGEGDIDRRRGKVQGRAGKRKERLH